LYAFNFQPVGFSSQDLADSLVGLVEIARLYIPLQGRDVGLMRLAQSEALGKNLEQALVGGRRIVDHCSVGLEQDVDGRDRVLSLSTQWLRMSEQRSQQADAQCRRHLRICRHVILPLLVTARQSVRFFYPPGVARMPLSLGAI
jgi:hypothetical protein